MTEPIEGPSPEPYADLLGDLRSFGERGTHTSQADRVDGAGGGPIDDALAARLLTVLAASRAHDAEIAALVCELAAHPDPSVRRRGQQMLFSTIAESLGDAFDPRSVAVHDSVFAHTIDACRRLPGATHLDASLTRFGLTNAADLLHRKSTLVPSRPIPAAQRARVRKVFVLSRITLGADVAVTSILLQAAQRAFPSADRCLVGPASVGALIGGVGGARHIEQAYDRSGLLERLGAWHDLTDVLDREMGGLDDAECVVIDPDSRLTQLGLLPVVRSTVPHLFFESRAYRVVEPTHDGRERPVETLGELTAHWASRALGCDDCATITPRIALSLTDARAAGALVAALRRGSGARVVAVNLGVGGNPRKRLGGSFELDLVRALLADRSAVLLDYGAGEDEARVRTIVDALKAEGRRVGTVGAEPVEASLIAGCEVLAHHGLVGPFAALAGASDLYVGYDSGFQHIAAAQGVPVVDVFVDPPNALFPKRWRPHSIAPALAVQIADHAAGHRTGLSSVLDACRRIRGASAAAG